MQWIRKPRSTGWRDVSDLLSDGWTGGVYVQRSETTVMVRVHALSASSATGGTPFTLPLGLRPETWSSAISARPLLHTTADPVVVRRSWVSSGGSLRIYSYSQADVLYGDFRFDTADPWPTTLPGVST